MLPIRFERCAGYVGCDYAIRAVGADGCLLSVGGDRVRVPAWKIENAELPGLPLSESEMVGVTPLNVKKGRHSLFFRHRLGVGVTPIELKVIIGADKPTGEACYYVHGLFSHPLSRERLRRFLESAQKESIAVNFVDGVDGKKAARRPQCLPAGHSGYNGVWQTMSKVWRRALERCPHDWIVDFEDDAVIPAGFVQNLERFIAAYPHLQIIWLDERTGGAKDESPESINSKSKFARFIRARLTGAGCCTAGMAYEKTAMVKLLEEFDLNNPEALWNGYEGRDKAVSHVYTPEMKADKATSWPHYECLTDLYLANVVAEFHIAAASYGLVQHDNTAKSLIHAIGQGDDGAALNNGEAAVKKHGEEEEAREKKAEAEAAGNHTVVRAADVEAALATEAAAGEGKGARGGAAG